MDTPRRLQKQLFVRFEIQEGKTGRPVSFPKPTKDRMKNTAWPELSIRKSDGPVSCLSPAKRFLRKTNRKKRAGKVVRFIRKVFSPEICRSFPRAWQAPGVPRPWARHR